MSKHNNTITLHFATFIELTLGARHCRELPNYELGLIVQEMVKDETLFKVQFEDHEGSPLVYPILWYYRDWHDSLANYKRQKAWSHKERVKRFIQEANIKIVARHLVMEYSYDEDRAKTQACHLVSLGKFGSIRAIGVKKLVTKEEELR